MTRDATSNPIEVVRYWTDVTERKRMEEALLRAERLAAVGQMATMVAHDFRNPLTSISGAAYYIRKKLGASTDKELTEMLEIIEKDVSYADRILSDLLEYSGEFEMELVEAHLRSIMEQALALVSIPSGTRARNLMNGQLKARLDTGKMKRVFLNLIENGVDVMPQGGELRIQGKESDGALQVVVSDTGAGMAEDAVKRIWTPFLTTKAKGVGLRLSISKRIMEAHKDYISYETEVGKGTAFAVTIPLQARNHDSSC